jgi:hypothetical protein
MAADVSAAITTSHTTAMGELTLAHPDTAAVRQDNILAHISLEIQSKSYSGTDFIKHHTNI